MNDSQIVQLYIMLKNKNYIWSLRLSLVCGLFEFSMNIISKLPSLLEIFLKSFFSSVFTSHMIQKQTFLIDLPEYFEKQGNDLKMKLFEH